jgi:hypothetical protein
MNRLFVQLRAIPRFRNVSVTALLLSVGGKLPEIGTHALLWPCNPENPFTFPIFKRFLRAWRMRLKAYRLHLLERQLSTPKYRSGCCEPTALL